jgi:hypothetical protein
MTYYEWLSHNPWHDPNYRDPPSAPPVVGPPPPRERWVAVDKDGKETDYLTKPTDIAAIHVRAKTYPSRVTEETLSPRDRAPPGHGWRHVKKTLWRRVRERRGTR